MALTKVRQQGGAMILTIPRDYATAVGWTVGTEISVERHGVALSFAPAKRAARGRLSVAQLLGQIDHDEIATLNRDVADFAAEPAGKEFW